MAGLRRLLLAGCLGAAVVVLLLLAVLGALTLLAPGPLVVMQARPAPTPPQPRLAGSWEARGDTTTRPFTLVGGSARIDVSLERQVCLTLRRLETNAFVNNACLRQSGPTYLYVGPGSYYLEVSSLAPWSLTITDLP
jgi:hypothetical protein